MDEKVMIFIDGSNLYMGLKHQFAKSRINVAKLMEKLAGGRPLVRAYYYSAPLDPTDSPQEAVAQQRFFNALRQVPYLTLRMGKLVRVDAVNAVKDCGKHVENAFPRDGWARELQDAADKRIVLDSAWLSDVWL